MYANMSTEQISVWITVAYKRSNGKLKFYRFKYRGSTMY